MKDPNDAKELCDFVQAKTEAHWKKALDIYFTYLTTTSSAFSAGNPSSEHRMLSEEPGRAIERIFRTLTGVSLSLVAELPDELRERGEGILALAKNDEGDVTTQWQSSQGEQVYDLASLIEREACEVGEIESEDAELIASIVIKKILKGEVPIPDLTTLLNKQAGTTQLMWKSSSPGFF